jgi:hypothetical protein
MGDLVELSSYRAHEPMMRGPAKCLHCKHEWEAVVPGGVFRGHECPSCGLFKGTMIGLAEPQLGESRYVCSCGNDLYYIMLDGYMCALCGAES